MAAKKSGRKVKSGTQFYGESVDSYLTLARAGYESGKGALKFVDAALNPKQKPNSDAREIGYQAARIVRALLRDTPKLYELALEEVARLGAVKLQPAPTVRYVARIPETIPRGMFLCHNFKPTKAQMRMLNLNGFRAWLTDRLPSNFDECNCGWAPHLPKHYNRARVVNK